ncbi:MAG: hypothetical protein Q7S99_03045 [Parvibaculum sp.]|nr:hypothetical protein [Parvibaculum sp.]
MKATILTPDLKTFIRGIERTTRDQLPFVMAKTLTDTAKDAQTTLRSDMAGKMTLRSTWAAKGIRITPARKSDGFSHMRAEVGSKDWFMADQLDDASSIRAPKTSKYRYIPKAARPNKASKIPKRLSPGAVLNGKYAFVTKSKNGGISVFKRGINGLTLMYQGIKRQKITPKVSLHRSVQQSTRAKVEINFARNWKAAHIGR